MEVSAMEGIAEDIIRPASPSDEEDLRRIWKTVFGDSDELIKTFFDSYFAEYSVFLAESESRPVAAGHIIHVGNLALGTERLLCGMIYSVATLPDFRGRGLGTAIVRDLLSLGFPENLYEAIVLCPSSDNLFEYYSSRTDLIDWFYVAQTHYSSIPISSDNATLREVDAKEYATLRGEILSGIPHIEFDNKALSFQSSLCKQYGGGFFSADLPKGSACVLIEIQADGAVWIKELLSDTEDEHSILFAVSEMFPSSEYLVRTPAYASKPASQIRRFGMLSWSNMNAKEQMDNADKSLALPYYGIAFD